MREQVLMGKDYLEPTCLALADPNRELAILIANILREAPVVGKLESQSSHAQFAVNLDAAQLSAILEALMRIVKERGYNAKYGGKQINALVVIWRDFIETQKSLGA